MEKEPRYIRNPILENVEVVEYFPQGDCYYKSIDGTCCGASLPDGTLLQNARVYIENPNYIPDDVKPQLESMVESKNTLDNFILKSDSYKFSHWLQYPKGSDGYFGYIESRGCNNGWKHVVPFGLSIFLKKYMSKPFTQENIDEADAFMKLHGEPFNREGWEYILKKYNGYLPITIKSVPEGLPMPLHVPLLTIECVDPKVFWLGSWAETSLLRAFWYTTTVCTLSWHCKQIIKEEMLQTCDNLDGLAFKLHDFGARGVSSGESAGNGGAAHLVNFMGSDTVEGIWTANKFYNILMAGFSIPAAEHSTITSWGKDEEVEAYRNMLRQYAKPGALVAVVSDSYDIFNACDKLWGDALKQEVIDSGAVLIIRPDSGDPEEVTLRCIEILGNRFGWTNNTKGYKVLKNVRLIQGDGINERSIKNILANFRVHGWSADNIAFGMGGMLLQGINRDTLEFALKCSAIRINNVWMDVSKNPVTSAMKKSKAGRLSSYQVGHGEPNIQAMRLDEYEALDDERKNHVAEILQVAYELSYTELFSKQDMTPAGGYYRPVIKGINFENVRANSNR